MTTSLQKSIMRRVYIVWFARRVVNSVSLKLLAIVVLLADLRQYASIKHVIYNSPSFMHPMETMHFFGHAFAHAAPLVEMGTLGIGVLGVFLMRDVFVPQRTVL